MTFMAFERWHLQTLKLVKVRTKMENIARFLVIGGIILILIGGARISRREIRYPAWAPARGYSHRRTEWFILFSRRELNFGFNFTDHYFECNY